MIISPQEKAEFELKLAERIRQHLLEKSCNLPIQRVLSNFVIGDSIVVSYDITIRGDECTKFLMNIRQQRNKVLVDGIVYLYGESFRKPVTNELERLTGDETKQYLCSDRDSLIVYLVSYARACLENQC